MKRAWLAVIVVFPALLFAQCSELKGSVISTAGVSVADARIELRNQETGVRLHIKTDRSGNFRFRSLRPGLYQATVQSHGFKTLTRDGIALHEGERGRIEITLQPNIHRFEEHAHTKQDHE